MRTLLSSFDKWKCVLGSIFIFLPIYCVLTIFRFAINYNMCWGESFDNVSHKCAFFNSSVRTCDIQFKEKCSETLTMEYSSVVAYIKWNTWTQAPIIVIGCLSTILCAAHWKIDSPAVGYIVALIPPLTEAMQFSNYVLILTLVGPANGFMAANTTTGFRVFVSIDGLLTGINLAVVPIAIAIEYCRSRCSQPKAISNGPPTSQPRATLEQQPLALIRVEYKKAVRKGSVRGKIPTTIEITNFNRSNVIDLLDELSHALQQLWKEHAHLIGKGKDAKGLAHSYMDIRSIRHVNNQYALSQYSCRRQAICDFTASVGGNLRNLHEYKKGRVLMFATQVVKTDNVFQSNCTFSKKLSSSNVDKRINEYYLFHGTRSLNAESIAKHGFDVSKCKEDSMLGRGIYFTDSLVKADQYTQPDDSGICCVIMARVLLGDFVVATNRSDIPYTSIQPPCKECMTTVCMKKTDCMTCMTPGCKKKTDCRSCITTLCMKKTDCMTCMTPVCKKKTDCMTCMTPVCKKKTDNPHPRFDSVVYTGGLYKEFVVYDNGQAYPEFIIFYKRL